MAIEKRLDTVNIRMRESMVDAIVCLAREEGIDRSKWVCRLIESALQEERKKYLALHSIFGKDGVYGKENSVLQSNTDDFESENANPARK